MQTSGIRTAIKKPAELAHLHIKTHVKNARWYT